MLAVDMRKANFSSGGTFSRYQSNKIRQLLGEETIIHLDYVTQKVFSLGVDQVGHHHTARKLTQCRLRPIKFLLEQNYVQSHVALLCCSQGLEFAISFNQINREHYKEIESHHTKHIKPIIIKVKQRFYIILTQTTVL